MRIDKISRRELLASCSEPGADDGQDPRYDRRTPGRRPGRKGLQLCGQVARTLAAVLAGECADELLRDLVVESVTPAPNAGRLLVTVALAPSADPGLADRAAERLERARGRLRAEVAAAVHRRRVPDLVFRLVDPAD
jgi:ribosome-binding factor A